MQSEDSIRAALASAEMRLARLSEVCAAPGDTIAALIAEKQREAQSRSAQKRQRAAKHQEDARL